MKKSLKILFVILSVFTALFLGGAIGTFVTQITLIGPSLWGVIFKELLLDAATFGKRAGLLLMPYSGIIFYASIGVGVILMLLSIILVKKNVGLKIVSAIFSFLIAVVGVMVASIITNPSTVIDFNAAEIGLRIGSYAIVILSGLYVIFTIILVILAMVHTRKAAKKSKDVFAEESTEEDSDKLDDSRVEALSAPADPVEYDDLAAEHIPVFIPEPEPEPEIAEQPAPAVVEPAAPETVREIVREVVVPVQIQAPSQEPAPAPAPAPAQQPIDPKELAAIIRDIVRDEIARNNAQQPKQQAHPTTDNHSIVGATFGGPLIVQYFGNGMSPVSQNAEPVVQPAPAPAPAPVAAPTPTVVEVVKPQPIVAVKPAPVAKPVPAPAVVEPAAPKDPIIRIPFETRMISADKEMQENYNIIKNEILSYGVKSRVSSSGDTFRLHRKTYVKLTIAGKSLKLYFALNPDDYKDSTIPVQDAGNKAIYGEIPLVFKVKSDLSLKRCKELIQTAMETDSLEQGEVGNVNWVKELKIALKDKAKKAADKDD